MIRPVTTLLVCLALAAGIARAAPPEAYAFLPLGEAWQSAQQQQKPMLLYFGRYGCTTCRKMHAEVFTDPDLRRRYSEDFVLAYVDTESGNRIRLANGERTTEMQFATRNRILGTPTFVFFSPEQKPLFKKAGFQSITQMNHYHGFIKGGHYREQTLADYSASQ
ncbi:MAG: thioredoxin fold domain-containing protein [Gammaproteobacteria bacterium]|nr:thioredoxin fold domain-containing protein [Gammaproteobacteria bacterium]